MDIVWVRSPQSQQSLLAALREMDARYIGDEIDPATGIERTHVVSPAFIQSADLMMLLTRFGFLDLFDYAPGLPNEDVRQLLASSVESGGVRYASLQLLRRMKQASGRDKDRIDLENLPE